MREGITNNLDLWTSALLTKSSVGRGTNGKREAYGIKKLRELILELAVRGKLVPQDPNDEPAAELLERAGVERARLVMEGIGTKSKDFPPIADDETPFILPETWKWARINDVGHDWGQKIPDATFTYIDVSAIDNSSGAIRSPTVLSASDAPSRARKIVRGGTVIYSTVRPYLKNISVIEEDYEPEPIASTAFAILHPLQGMSGRFFAFYFRSPEFVRYVESVQTGIAYPAINDKQFYGGLIPIPPLAEQRRIVAKVDELMALCDHLEQQQAHSLEAHETLVETLLGTLTRVASQQEPTEAWTRIASHFDTLFTTEHSVDQLKQTILQLAVMGKLVPQYPDDVPASVLLERIAMKKERLIRDGSIKKQKPTSPIADEEMPFKLPQTWVWERLGNLAIQITDGTHHTPSYVESGVPFISVKDLDGRTVSFNDCKYISQEQHEDINSRCNPEYGDLLICRIGTLGRATIVDTREPFSLFVSVGLLKFLQNYFIPEYAHIVLHSPLLVNQYEEIKAAGSHTNKLNLGDLPRLKIPLAPLAEQHRIVAKVDELMVLCDDLKARMNDAQTTQIDLADAVVERAVA